MAKLGEVNCVILDDLAKTILANVEGCVVDIGIGSSTKVLSKHAKDLDRPHYTCDVKRGKCEWARTVGCVAFEGRSLDFIKTFPDIPVALVFLDGEHLYETVLQEVDFFLGRLSDGGVIFLHDTHPPKEFICESGRRCGNVYRVRQQLEHRMAMDILALTHSKTTGFTRMPALQVFTWPYTALNCGLTMVMKNG